MCVLRGVPVLMREDTRLATDVGRPGTDDWPSGASAPVVLPRTPCVETAAREPLS